MKVTQIDASLLTYALSRLMVGFFVLLVFFTASKNLNSEVVGVDASEALTIAHNLIVNDTFSLKDKFNNNESYATNFREPLPIFLWAQSLEFFVGTEKIKKTESLQGFPELVKAKYPNLLFLLLLLCTICMLVYSIPKRYAGAWTKALISIAIILTLNIYGLAQKVNGFSNDIHTSALLGLLVLLIVYYFKAPSEKKLMIIGAVYGLLCLTKATFFYSGIVTFGLAIIYQLFNKINVKSSVTVFIVSLMVTTPWLVRNYVQTGQTAISGRGPETFIDRTYEEIYNDSHFIGLWYAYSPDFLKPLATKLTGYGFEDRLKGGRLQFSTRAHVNDHKARELLDDSMAINTHFKACIWMRKVYNSVYQKHQDPVLSIKQANGIYQNFALKEMFSHPIRHLKFTVIFAWRGIWILNAIDGRTNYEMRIAKQEPLVKQILPFLGFVSLIGLFVYGVIKRNAQLMLMTVFSVAAYGFNSFFSHNLPRYGEAFLPIWLLSFVFVVLLLKVKMRSIYERFKEKLVVS